jgi:acetylornithine deacetylase/succinyl-diaminopimelate desuccinylase family protein
LNAIHETLADLIRINSVNAFYENGVGESEIANYVARFFSNRGIEVQQQVVYPAKDGIEARCNVVAKLPGKNSNRRIILEAHMDTVSTQGMTIPPFEATVSENRMYGRGSCDTKAGLAAMMHVLADFQQKGIEPPCEVWLAAVVDEEYSFGGVASLCQGLRANAAIIAEPTELRLVVASKGVLRWRMVAHGRSAHSSKTHLGVNAIYHMARVALLLEQDNARLGLSTHPLLGPATCNVGKIKGGVQVNFVPDSCAIEIDRRLLPSETVAQVLEHYEGLLTNLRCTVPEFDVRMEPPMLVDEAWCANPKSEVVQVSSQVLRELGCDSELAGVPFGSDASKLERTGVPSIIFGPGSIDQAHAAVEFVALDQVDLAFEFYRRVVQAFE